jgi:adenine-specific DNA-methyltransferase
MTTAKKDIILDFFAGAGTTGAVAHKMGRRYILVEQMDYIQDLPEARLKLVVAGEQGGISKAVNWQGGGSFVYCELKEWNEEFIRQIKDAKDTSELLNIYAEMRKQREYFFRYDFEHLKFDRGEFANLPLSKQKELLCQILNKNHLYVNYSERNDVDYKITDLDKKLTASFYGE